MGKGVRQIVVLGAGKFLYRALHHLTPPPLVMMTMVSIVGTVREPIKNVLAEFVR